MRSWRIFIGPWLSGYVSILNDRLKIANKIIKSKYDISKIIKTGKNISLISNDTKEFTLKATQFDWNEKLFSRLIYLLKEKNTQTNIHLLTHR